MRRRSVLRGATLTGVAVAGGLVYRYLGRGASGPLGKVGLADNDVCIVAPTHAYDPSSGLPPTAAREVPEEARCPVCGMYPARHRRWAAQVIFRDGHAQFLDSPLSLFIYLQQVNRFSPGRQAADIETMYVSDQRSTHWLQAEQAVYVHGSSLMGPMRAGNLPAFASEDEALVFRRERGGVSLSAAQLRRRLPADLQGLAPHAHQPLPIAQGHRQFDLRH